MENSCAVLPLQHEVHPYVQCRASDPPVHPHPTWGPLHLHQHAWRIRFISTMCLQTAGTQEVGFISVNFIETLSKS